MNLGKTSVEVLKITRSSKLFQPINVLPTESSKSSVRSQIMSKSQKLFTDLGIVRPSGGGVFHLLPLGIKSMKKLESLIRSFLSQVEGQEIKMPAIIDGFLWKKSGRWDTAGTEIFKFRNRHGSDCILSPTNEESAAELIAGLGQLNQSQLPILLYQITSKYRDEMKPRSGLIRTKEFEMMDAYSFDRDLESARSSYERVSAIFERILNHLELPFIKAMANSGLMGGEISHEYHLESDVGEDTINICQSCSQGMNIDYSSSSCPSCGSASLKQVKGIEVGHTFMLDTIYTLPMECKYRTLEGKMEPLVMGSYGLGLTRILAASAEYLSSEEEIIWPTALAPFSVCVIPPKEGSKEWDAGSVLSLDMCKELEKILPNDVLLDDRCWETIGKRLWHARRTGFPYVICVGKNSTKNPPTFELISTVNNTTDYFTLPELIKYFEDFLLRRRIVLSAHI